MSRGKQHNSDTESAHLTLEQMQAYLEDTLPGRNMHQIERHLLDCELCSDALEGLSAVPQPDHISGVVSKLRQNIRKKSLRQPIIRRKKKLVTILWKPMGVAAAVLILLTAIVLLMRIDKKYRNSPQQLSMSNGKKAEKAAEFKPEATQPEPQLETARNQKPITLKEQNGRVQADEKTEPTQKKLSPKQEELLAADEIYSNNVTIAPAPPVSVSPEAETEETQRESLPLVPPITESTKARSADQIPDASKAKLNARQASGISQSAVMITGKVMYSGDESPLAGVNVTVKGTNQGTVTDAEGNFRLLAPTESSLVFNYIGFATEEVQIKGQEALKISLKDDVSALSEVVVSGYGTSDKTTSDAVLVKPQPAKGFPDYKAYLRNNLKYPETALQNKIEGNVRVEFVVEANGALSDFKIKKGLGYGCDEEAIRLVKEGPAWKPATRNDEPVRRKFNVIVPFKLK